MALGEGLNKVPRPLFISTQPSPAEGSAEELGSKAGILSPLLSRMHARAHGSTPVWPVKLLLQPILMSLAARADIRSDYPSSLSSQYSAAGPSSSCINITPKTSINAYMRLTLHLRCLRRMVSFRASLVAITDVDNATTRLYR